MPALRLALALCCVLAGARTAWRALGAGGGGAMFLPSISPHDARTALLACDMTGVYLTRDGGASWRIIDLHGRAQWFAFDPLNARTIYAYSIGLWRSDDAGAHWRMIYPAHARGEIIAGDHAERRPLAPGAATISAFAVDPADARAFYGVFTTESGTFLRFSVDGGRTWRDNSTLPAPALALYVDPRSPLRARTLYVPLTAGLAVRERGQWRMAGGPALVSASGGFSAGGGDFVLYAVTSQGLAIWRHSTARWQRPLAGLAPRAVATSLHHAAAAYVSASTTAGAWWKPWDRPRTVGGVWKTTDGGANWRLAWDESRVDSDGWVARVLGAGWAGHPLALGVAPDNPSLVYATHDGRALRTTDGGASWHAVYTRATGAGGYRTTGLNVTTVYGVHFDPRDARHLFATCTDIGLWSSRDGGLSWTRAMRGVPAAWANTAYWLVADALRPGRWWAAFSDTHDLPRPKMWRHASTGSYHGGLCRSDDDGAHWTPVRAGLPDGAVTHILIDAQRRSTLYAVVFGQGVFRTADGGANWRAMSDGLPARPLAWRLAQEAGGALYLVIARSSEDGSYGDARDGALYVWDGARWRRLVLPTGVNGPMGLQAEGRTLVLAAWGRLERSGDRDGGIWRSSDGAATWRHVLARDQHIYDITADPAHPATLYAAGFEGALWRSGDWGATWRRLAAPCFEWLQRALADPVHPGQLYLTTYGAGLWHGAASPAREEP